MRQDSTRRSNPQQRRIAECADNVGSVDFFNLLTCPQLQEFVDELLSVLTPGYRERKYSPLITLAMFLRQVLSADGSCQNAVNEAVVNRLHAQAAETSLDTSGYCAARKRLPGEMVTALLRQVANVLNEQMPAAWGWRGRHVKIVDGTTILMPDTPENQARYPQHGNQAPGTGFPLARVVGVTSLAHGGVLDWTLGAHKGKGTGELGLLRELENGFVQNDVALADALYCSYFQVADGVARGVDVVLEQHGSRHTDFRTGKRLGALDHVVTWRKPAVRPAWMTPQEYERCPDDLILREVRVGKKVLVTSFLNPREVSRRALDKLYRQRWHVELDIRNIKDTLGMETLTCKSPEMCEKEVGMYFLAYNLIRLLMGQAAIPAHVLPRELSFKHTVQVWLAWSQRQFLLDAGEDPAELLRLIAKVRVGDRPGRIEPRAVKQRPKPFPRLQIPRRKARENIRKYGRPSRLSA